MGQPVTLVELLRRVREGAQRALRNGETTERALAMRVGVSQPYLHHVLKGARRMRPELADRLMQQTGLSVESLLRDYAPMVRRDDTASR